MNVTILSNSKGGVFTVTMQWARGLVQKGCNVTLFFLMQPKEADTLAFRGVRFHYFVNSFFLPNLRALFAFFAHDHPDVLHISFAWFGPFAIFKKWMQRTPFVYTLHGLPQPSVESSVLYKIAYVIEHCLLRSVASQSSGVVTVSNYVKQMLKKVYGLEAEVIHHGIDVEGFPLRNRLESKQRLGYKKTDFVILFVGRFHPSKDPFTIIKALSEARNSLENLYLLMIADPQGPVFKEIRKAISRSNLVDHVKILSNLSSEMMKSCYNASDMFVLTSLNEAFGMVLLEAMASGLPVVASHSGASPEVVGDAGILFTQGDHLSLAHEIAALASDVGLSQRLRVRGLRRVQEAFSWSDKVDKYWKLYKQAQN